MKSNITIEGDYNVIRVPENKDKDGTVKKRKWFKKRIFILMVILVFLSGQFFVTSYFSASSTNDRIYKRLYQNYDVDLDYKLDYNKAIKLYKTGLYKEAIEQFNKLVQKDSLQVSYSFYLALSYHANENYYKAIDLYEDILSLKADNSYSNEVNWYLGLCYLKIQKSEKAKVIFKELIQQQNDFRDNAYKAITLIEKSSS